MHQENSSSNITVNVAQSQKKAGHHVYPITGQDKNGQFNSLKRYSEFDQLRTILIARWPGCYIPSLPEKKFLGNEDSIFIEIRRQGLHFFMNSLKEIQHIWYSEEIQLFLRKLGDEKQLTKMKDTNLTQILARYKDKFPEYFNMEVSKDLNTEIIQFNQYLKRATGLLQNLQKMAQQMFSTRKKLTQKYLNMIEAIIPGYETNSMGIYLPELHSDELIFTGPKKQRIQSCIQELKGKKNSIIYLLEEIKRQKYEVIAFEQILKVKQNYSTQKQKAISKVKDLQIQTTKINAGKQSLFSKITNKSKQVQIKQIQTSINKAQQQEKNLGLICQVMTVLLGNSQIKKFKSFREKSYYHLLKKLFEAEKQQNHAKRNIWTIVSNDSSQKEEVTNFFGDETQQMLNQQTINQLCKIQPQSEQSQLQNEEEKQQIHQQKEQNCQQFKIQEDQKYPSQAILQKYSEDIVETQNQTETEHQEQVAIEPVQQAAYQVSGQLEQEANPQTQVQTTYEQVEQVNYKGNTQDKDGAEDYATQQLKHQVVEHRSRQVVQQVPQQVSESTTQQPVYQPTQQTEELTVPGVNQGEQQATFEERYHQEQIQASQQAFYEKKVQSIQDVKEIKSSEEKQEGNKESQQSAGSHVIQE